MKKQLIIIGGGYGGIRAMQGLSSVKELDIVLIDQNPYHYLQTEAYALIANAVTLTDVTVDLVALCKRYKNTRYKKAHIRDIDLITKKVKSDDEELNFDYLIIATGSRTNFPVTIAGLEKHSHGVKTLQRAFEFKQQFEYQLYERMQSEEDLFCKAFNVVICGAGLSGVEIAAEMGHYAKKFIHDNRMLCEGIHIYLIASQEKVLDGMNPYFQTKAQQRLDELGVIVLYNTRIAEVKEDEVLLDNGRCVNFDFMIFAGGVKASSLAKSLGCPLNEKGQVTVHQTLQVTCHKNIYAIGDVAALVDVSGNVIPATANAAEQSAGVVVKNIKAQLKGERPQHAFIGLQGMMVTLGGSNAAVVLFNTFKVSGFLGYLLKRLITWRYKYLLDRHALKAYKAMQRVKR
ncbi:MAG: FAD-dependent oxidoreductase [Sulfurimonadaceae bacterium]